MVTTKIPKIEIEVQIILKCKYFDTTHKFFKWSALHFWGNTDTCVHIQLKKNSLWSA